MIRLVKSGLALALVVIFARPIPTQGAAIGVNLDDFSLRDAVVDQDSTLQQELAADFEDTFGGLWVDGFGLTTVAFVHPSPQLADRISDAGLVGPWRLVQVDYSQAELRAAHLALRKAVDWDSFSLDGLPLASISEDIQANRVRISIVAPVESLGRVDSTLAAGPYVLDSAPVAASPAACNRQNCGSPMKAGLQLYNSSGGTSCMSNFQWRTKTTPYNYYIGSAGHCHSVGNAIYHPNGTRIGYVTYSSAGPNSGVDASLTNIAPSNASNKIYIIGGQIGTITQTETVQGAVIGEGVCSSKLSSYLCGTLRKKGVDTCCALDQFSADGQNVVGGDSGSPVFYGSKAEGIISNSDCDGTNDCYSPVQDVTIWKSFLTMVTS